jgi:hypothetical protein
VLVSFLFVGVVALVGVFAVAGVLVSASVRTSNAVLLACFIAVGLFFLKALCLQIFQLLVFPNALADKQYFWISMLSHLADWKIWMAD